MTTAKLIIDGKEIEVQLTDEQAQELTAPNKVTGFERVKHSEMYFCTDSGGNLVHDFEYGGMADQLKYENANYYTDESLAEWCIRNDTLNRKMRRWAAEHNSNPIDWTDDDSKWYIYYDFRTNEIKTDDNANCCSIERVYFRNYPTALNAIIEFGDEIKWLAENRPKWF